MKVKSVYLTPELQIYSVVPEGIMCSSDEGLYETNQNESLDQVTGLW